MRFPYEMAAAFPAVSAGLTLGKATESLHAPAPWPQLTFLIATLLAAYILDRLIDPIRDHLAATRG